MCVCNRVNNVTNEANEGREEVDGVKLVAVAHPAKHCGRKETTGREKRVDEAHEDQITAQGCCIGKFSCSTLHFSPLTSTTCTAATWTSSYFFQYSISRGADFTQQLNFCVFRLSVLCVTRSR
ncbi:hypothetical protein PsorP6_003655 [Peronosclerospora sorghi]|uniref:Uncharacterized protein n=1 Tax=Peronosclerospora sorghi TaxID=230839 RepID=A0ACC0VQA4_9STRA|nr:hypothetical protein PsorP6_003655 [Peronosclerospora sorghi]